MMSQFDLTWFYGVIIFNSGIPEQTTNKLYFVFYILFSLENDMSTSTYFVFVSEGTGLNEHPPRMSALFWKLEN